MLKILCSSPFFLSASASHLSYFFVSTFFFLSASAPHLSSFFCFNLFWSVPLPFLLLFSAHLFSFLVPHSLFCFRHVALLSLAENIIFSPKRFSAQTCCSFSASLPFFFFFYPYVFKGHPKTCCSPKSFCFSSNSFSVQRHSFSSFSAPPFFLFFSSVYPRPNILSSCFTSLLFE